MEACGNMELLQREIAMLKMELDNLRLGVTEPIIQENAQLRKQLAEFEQVRRLLLCSFKWVAEQQS